MAIGTQTNPVRELDCHVTSFLAIEEAGKAGGRADEPPIDAKGGVEPFVGAAAEAADAGRPGEKESLPPFGEGNGDSDVPFPISPVAAPGTRNIGRLCNKVHSKLTDPHG